MTRMNNILAERINVDAIIVCVINCAPKLAYVCVCVCVCVLRIRVSYTLAKATGRISSISVDGSP